MNELFTEEFWLNIAHKLMNWAVTELPVIILTIILFIIALTFFNKLTKKLKPYLLKRKYIENSKNKKEAEKRMVTLMNISQGTIKVILWIIFLLIILTKVGIEVAPFLAGAGIIGLAVGFGAQELIRDVITGFFVLLENQIRVSDFVIINGTAGEIEKIELRTVTLRDLAGTVHIFQHGKINTLSNMTKEWSASIVEIGVAYKENVDEVIKIMKEVSDDLEKDDNFKNKIIEPLEIMGLDRFDNSAIVIKAILRTIPGQQWAAKREYNKRIKKRFDKENIEIPFPHTTLYFGEKSAPMKVDLAKN